MNPSPSAVAWIRAQSPDWSRTDAEIAADLNALAVDNPVTQADVLKPFGVPDVFGLLSPPSMAAVADVAYVPDIRDKVVANDREGCGHYAALLVQSGKITPAEYQALAAMLAATEPDPSWTATVPAPVAALGRVLDGLDIQASRPQAGG